jgi:S-adenosylmethionine:tRNA ribosyltransferase-isomerase
VRTADFHYDLPPELIAQHPARQRDASRLLVLHRAEERLDHRRFRDLPEYLRPGDVLVLNDSRVIPARLRGIKPATGGEVEVLLVEENRANDWWAMLRPGKRVRAGTRIEFVPGTGSRECRAGSGERGAGSTVPGGDAGVGATRREPALAAVVRAKSEEGLYRLHFEGPADLREDLDRFGEVPLPPYIGRDGPPPAEDRERYQTIYAGAPGSVAAPTAGLHFTGGLLDRIKELGVEICFVTLHVGLGTFAPVKADRLEDHVMHEEGYEVSAATLALLSRAKAAGRRIIAVGTTSVRVLETVAADISSLRKDVLRGRTRLFLRPPARFRVVDALLTNFHLPESTLLMLVCAFAAPGALSGRDLVLRTYAQAIQEGYRFFSYGDAMLVL